MGTSYSLLEKEKFTWNYHCLLFDEVTRETNLKVIDEYFPNDTEIQLASHIVSNGGLGYQHFFITDTTGARFLELSSADQNSEKCYDTYRVQCNTLPHGKYEWTMEKTVNLEIKERMIQLLGMCNYSLCLRNSEHVANYIFTGKWASLQMEGSGSLSSFFESKMTENQRKKINIFPSTIAPKTVEGSSCPKLYSIIDKQYTPTRFQYFLDANEETYNILVVGPTGAGKSRLINVLFNREICDSKVSHKSVTRDVCFIEGSGELIKFTPEGEPREKQTKKIVVADTVGLCDTEWDDDKIFDLLKGRVSRNFKSIDAVFIVFRADRLLREHIKNIEEVMKWLKYDDGSNYLNFLFVGTFAENLSTDEKDELKEQARKILKLRDTEIPESGYESLVYVGFPPEKQLNDEGMKQVQESWDLLQPLVRLNEKGQQLKGYEEHVRVWLPTIKEALFWLPTIELRKITNSCTIL
ncbi:hypothetical protein HA402_007766 [Bradysia odoriphaga]|nr:hypothetical protein HA402_007766 [Bradysia odoriphaga]